MADKQKYGTQEVNKYADPKNWEIWDAPKHAEVVYQTFPEFTCLCPRSGYPDFATIHLITIPNKKVVELKCLKMWFNSFRNVGISHENMTQMIAKTLQEELGLHYIFVLMEYTPRGNLTTFPIVELQGKRSSFGTKELPAGMLDTVKTIKTKLLNKVI